MSESRLWILGAADPEMQAIEAILRAAGESVAYATVGGTRVHPGNAYKATSAVTADGQEVDWTRLPPSGWIAVECSVAGQVPAVVIDHHRPGDPGYGRGPEDLLPASSVGQVFSLLRREDRGRYAAALGAYYAPAPTGGSVLRTRPGEYALCRGVSMSGGTEPEELWMLRTEHSSFGQLEWVEVPKEVVLAAAADHCLEAAYRGRCPGVDPDELMRWRAESRAAFQRRPVADLLRDVEAARAVLREATRRSAVVGRRDLDYTDLRYEECPYCGGTGLDPVTRTVHCPQCGGQPVSRHVPELPEAAAREGIPYLAAVKDRDGREKVVLGAAPPELVTTFLAGEAVSGLTGYYGDPARGFAGGYVS